MVEMSKRAIVVAILLYVSSGIAFYVSNLRLRAESIIVDRPMRGWDYLGYALFFLAMLFTIVASKYRKR
jgi:hypothetical protein